MYISLHNSYIRNTGKAHCGYRDKKSRPFCRLQEALFYFFVLHSSFILLVNRDGQFEAEQLNAREGDDGNGRI
jgi:hypothetical protein